MSWVVILEINSELRPTELAIMVGMFPGVNDVRVVKGTNEQLQEGTKYADID